MSRTCTPRARAPPAVSRLLAPLRRTPHRTQWHAPELCGRHRMRAAGRGAAAHRLRHKHVRARALPLGVSVWEELACAPGKGCVGLQHWTCCSIILRLRIGGRPTDVWERQRPKDGVGHRVQQHIPWRGVRPVSVCECPCTLRECTLINAIALCRGYGCMCVRLRVADGAYRPSAPRSPL
jgi:hypothetical protein